MQLEKEKESRQDAERCRLLAQRIAEELAPESAAVLGDDEASCTALQKALRKVGVKHEVYHCNEGHAAFIGVERIRDQVETVYDVARAAKEGYEWLTDKFLLFMKLREMRK